MFFKKVIDGESSSQIKNVLLEQKKNYDKLKTQRFSNLLFYFTKNGEVVLPPDALIHGTKFNLNVLGAIKKDGILASEFASFKPDAYSETFYMADFFKNVTGKNMSVNELLNCKSKNEVISYLPSDNKNDNVARVAFIISSQVPAVKDYLKLDLFSDNNSSLYSFIDEEMFFSINRRSRLHQYNYKLGQASIPIGVPYSAICGVIIDKTIEDNKNGELDAVIELFNEDLFIISSAGTVLHAPKLSAEEEITI